MEILQKRTKSVVSPQDMKIANKKAILYMLKEEGPVSRTNLASCLNLSKATVSSLVNELMQEKFVFETGAIPTSGVGRNAIQLTFNASYGYVLVIDIGRFKIRIAISDLNGEVHEKQSRETSSVETLEDILQHISDSSSELMVKMGIQLDKVLSVCVSAPGIIDQNGMSKNTIALPQLSGINMAERLSNIFPNTYIQIENDVRIATVAENWKGFGVKYSSFVLLAIGSGLGCGFMIDGQLYRGASGAAGEIGFLKTSLNDDTPIEYDLSSDGIIQAANCFREDGEPHYTDVKSVFQHVSQNIGRHHVFIDWLVIRIVYLIQVINCVINPQAIVLGGGIGRHLSFIMPEVRKRIAQLNDPPQVEISGLGDDVQLVGAANLALNRVMKEILSN